MKKLSYHFWIVLLLPVILIQCTVAREARMADENAETVRLWFEEGWNHNRNEELLDRCFADDWRDGNPLRPNQVEGHEGMLQLVQSYRQAFPDARFTITHLFADAYHVAIRYEVTARHLGAMFGMEPTGKEFVSTGIVLYEMENGKIKTSWQELDLVGIMNQLEDDRLP